MAPSSGSPIRLLKVAYQRVPRRVTQAAPLLLTGPRISANQPYLLPTHPNPGNVTYPATDDKINLATDVD